MYPAASLNAALSAITALGSWVSLHTSDPGTTGAGEVTGGTPAYGRRQTAWGTPSAGVVTGSPQTLDIPAGTTIGWFGVWTAASGGTFVGGGPLVNGSNVAITESYTQQGQYALTPRLTADNLA